MEKHMKEKFCNDIEAKKNVEPRRLSVLKNG